MYNEWVNIHEFVLFSFRDLRITISTKEIGNICLSDKGKP